MSFLPKRYQYDENEGDWMDYEKKKPEIYAKYFKEDDGAQVRPPESPQMQKAEGFTPDYKSIHSKYFGEEEPRPDTSIRGHLERKVASPGIEFLLKAATAIPEFGKFIQKNGMQGVNYLLQQFGIGLSPEEFETANKVVQQISPILGGIPDESEISDIIKQATGGRLEPQTGLERGLKKGFGIAGSAVGFGPEAALGTPIRAAATAAMAGTTATLEEAGVNPWIALGGGLVADILTRSGKGIANFISDLAKKGISSKAGEIAGKAALVKPEQIKQGVVEAAERLGISQGEIPLSAQLDKPVIQSIESTLRESSLTGKSLPRQVENVEKKTLNAFDEIGNSVSKRQNLLPGAVSEEAVSQLKNVEKEAEQVYEAFYNQAEKSLPKDAVIDAGTGKKFYSMLDSTIKKLSGGSGNPAKDAVVARLTRLKNDWTKKYPNGDIPVRDLIEQKKDFNQIIKYETKGGADKMMKPLNHFVKNSVQDYGRKSNQPFLRRFNEAERRFGKTAEEFRKNNVVSSLLEGQNPEKILNDVKKVKNYRELQKLMERSAQGKEAFQDLSKYILEDVLGSQIKNKEGGISWAKASGMMKKPENREIIMEIVGPDNFNKLQDIAHFSGGIEEGLRKFANTSKSATKGMDVAFLAGTVMKIVRDMFVGNLPGAAKGTALLFTPYAMARLISNPKFIDAMVNTTKAAKGTNPSAFWDAATQASKYIAQEVAQDPAMKKKEEK